LRSLGFSWDGSEIWLRGVERKASLTLIPLVGETPRVFLGESATHPAWSPDGTRLVYHKSEDGDPLYVAERNGANGRRIFAGRPDQHNHFPVWSHDGNWIYFVHGTPANNEMDLWRIPSLGGEPERLTAHNNNDLRDPTRLGENLILYVARENNEAGPGLWAYDIRRKLTHRITQGLEQYTSVAASADGRRLAATVANPSVSLWSVPVLDRVAEESDVKPFPLPSVRALAPRLREKRSITCLPAERGWLVAIPGQAGH
jgi:Tol biopolymer transport system component